MSKKITLKVIEGSDLNTIYEMEEGKRYEVRRVPQGGIPDNVDRKKAIFLNDEEVSKLHASITVISGELIIQDLGSTNGVFVNNKRISKSLVNNNDKIRIGHTVFAATTSEENIAQARTFIGKVPSQYSKATHDFKKLAKVIDEQMFFEPDLRIQPPYNIEEKSYEVFLDLLEKMPKKGEEDKPMLGMVDDYMFSVTVLSGYNEGDTFDFYKKVIVLGRTKDLWLREKSVSREHAIVELCGAGIFKIKDLGSQNGTYVNDQKIQLATFRVNDVIRLGETALSFIYKGNVF